MSEFLCDTIKVIQNFIESTMVGGFEFIETVFERFCCCLEVVDFSPGFEFTESTKPLNYEWRIWKITIIDISMVPHDESAKFQRQLWLTWIIWHNMRPNINLPEQWLIRLESPEGICIIFQIIQEHLDWPHHKLIVRFLAYERKQDGDKTFWQCRTLIACETLVLSLSKEVLLLSIRLRIGFQCCCQCSDWTMKFWLIHIVKFW